jgi:hypothetical protein
MERVPTCASPSLRDPTPLEDEVRYSETGQVVARREARLPSSDHCTLEHEWILTYGSNARAKWLTAARAPLRLSL